MKAELCWLRGAAAQCAVGRAAIALEDVVLVLRIVLDLQLEAAQFLVLPVDVEIWRIGANRRGGVVAFSSSTQILFGLLLFVEIATPMVLQRVLISMESVAAS